MNVSQMAVVQERESAPICRYPKNNIIRRNSLYLGSATSGYPEVIFVMT